ncbi:MAG: ABC transporter ATP-binding protein [Oscillospiraceae bacterium]|nr:ABC transporter ATP-binding protein [Oscillospiraceae bacterium]
MSYITFKDVSKRFGGNYILENVNFEIEKGEICGFAGRNGSGKTVIFKLLSGLLLPTGGSIKFCGEEVSHRGRFIADTGVMLETPGFIPHYSGLKNLCVLNDLSLNKVKKKRLAELMERFNLEPGNKKPVRAYSLGMRQKLGIIQAVMNSPELLILDEPMNSLDEESTVSIRNFFSALNKEEGTTILIASHIKDDIHPLCSRIFTVANNTVKEII